MSQISILIIISLVLFSLRSNDSLHINRFAIVKSLFPENISKSSKFSLFAELQNSSPVFMTHYEELSVKTTRGVSLVDITKSNSTFHLIHYKYCFNFILIGIADIVEASGCKEGVLTLLSKHSTVSVTINEMESRLVDDTRQFLLKLAPPSDPYLHNDLDFRFHFLKHFEMNI